MDAPNRLPCGAPMPDTNEDERLLPEWRSYMERFPTVPDAVAAARRGEDTTCEMGDAYDMWMQILIAADGSAAIEEIYGVNLYLQQCAETTLISAGTDDAARSRCMALIVEGLREIARDAGIGTDVRVLPPDGTELPRFGVRVLYPADEFHGWGDVPESLEMITFADDRSHDQLHQLRASLAAGGLRVGFCKECNACLTDRHPDWPGVWIELSEQGPQCALRGWDSFSVHPPHEPVIAGQQSEPS